MNFIKDSLLHWRENTFSLQGDDRVILHDPRIQICGNCHPMLPTNFSTPLAGAFIASSTTTTTFSDQTTYFLIFGGVKVEIVSSITLHPSLEMAVESTDYTLSLQKKDGKILQLRLSDEGRFLEWHHALCEAVAEKIFARAFQYSLEGTLSTQRIEAAIRRASRLVAPANCHLLRAQRLWQAKKEVIEMLRRLREDDCSLSREHVHNFLQYCEIDRLLLQDGDFLRLRALEPRLPSQFVLNLETSLQDVTLADHQSLLVSNSPAERPKAAVSTAIMPSPRSPRGRMPLTEEWTTTQMSAPPSPLVTIMEQEYCEESDLHWQLSSPDKTCITIIPTSRVTLSSEKDTEKRQKKKNEMLAKKDEEEGEEKEEIVVDDRSLEEEDQFDIELTSELVFSEEDVSKVASPHQISSDHLSISHISSDLSLSGGKSIMSHISTSSSKKSSGVFGRLEEALDSFLEACNLSSSPPAASATVQPTPARQSSPSSLSFLANSEQPFHSTPSSPSSSSSSSPSSPAFDPCPPSSSSSSSSVSKRSDSSFDTDLLFNQCTQSPIRMRSPSETSGSSVNLEDKENHFQQTIQSLSTSPLLSAKKQIKQRVMQSPIQTNEMTNSCSPVHSSISMLKEEVEEVIVIEDLVSNIPIEEEVTEHIESTTNETLLPSEEIEDIMHESVEVVVVESTLPSNVIITERITEENVEVKSTLTFSSVYLFLVFLLLLSILLVACVWFYYDHSDESCTCSSPSAPPAVITEVIVDHPQPAEIAGPLIVFKMPAAQVVATNFVECLPLEPSLGQVVRDRLQSLRSLTTSKALIALTTAQVVLNRGPMGGVLRFLFGTAKQGVKVFIQVITLMPRKHREILLDW
eukprot:scaffold1404_cov173-Ochromonas_danica.AAC.3